MEQHRDLWWNSPTSEFGHVVHLDLPEPLRMVHGGSLPSLQVSYEAWGTLNQARDNAALIIHPMTADCHATGEFADQPTGWWEPLIGPGRAIDTDRFYVVCPNLVGGCYGTTGPRFPDAEGKPYLDTFPLLTPRDMMRVQQLFLGQLGVGRLHMAIGPGMGGMIAWEWAVEGRDMVETVVVVAAPLRTSPYQIGLNWLQRRGIELDITENEVIATVGQMVARGVGMMSYRSPVGLEEQFGREWFKEPGSTLRERGMYNVESWLRHHGRRITKRFDPYTYLLFSRAMDLHDVSDGRADLVTALNQVACRVLVIGISSDNLYPPAEVKLGADILDHFGRDVRYEEIRSPNGHDGFLLDTDQIETFVRGFLAVDERAAPVAAERALRPVRVGILGAGQVAASFVRLVEERTEQLADRHGIRFEIAAVAEIDQSKRLDPVFDTVDVGYDPGALVDRQDLDVILDLTRGLGTLELVERALRDHRPVVTPNKVLLCAFGEVLDRIAFDHGVRLAYHDSIAAGWPLMYALDRPLAHGQVAEIQAVLSSSCNVMLELMEDGADLETAVRGAVARDLTEPDPQLDVSGWDSAQKLNLLLTRATGRRHVGQELDMAGLDSVAPELVRLAPELGLRVKLCGIAMAPRGVLSAAVRPIAVRSDSHLGMVRDRNHAVVVHTRDGGEVVYSGVGGGALPVATAVLNDLVGVFDAEHSWTGRFPPVEASVPAVQFDTWLELREARPTVTRRETPGAIPLLSVVRGEASASDDAA
jgi:homoserine O-acetyltransferase